MSGRASCGPSWLQSCCTFIELQFLILLPPSPKYWGKFNPPFFLIFFMCIMLGWHPGPWTASPALFFPLRSFQLDSCHHNSAAVACAPVASDFHIAKPRASSQPRLACLTNEHSSLIPLWVYVTRFGRHALPVLPLCWLWLNAWLVLLPASLETLRYSKLA